MEIKKNMKFVCIKDVIMECTRQVNYVKGDVYTSEQDGSITNMLGEKWHLWSNVAEFKQHFIPYSKLDRVYTKHTPLLEKIFDKYDDKKHKVSNQEINWYCNCDVNDETGWFWGDSLDSAMEEYYEGNGFTYLSEQAFIEFMDLGKYIGSLNVESEEASHSFPTDWYLNLGNPEVDINIIKDYLRSLDGVDSNFIADVQGYLLGQDIMGDGSYQYWADKNDNLKNKYNLVEISYQDFLDNVYRKKEFAEEVPDYLNIAEEWSKEGDKEEVFNPQPHYDNSKGSLYKVATERGWSAYTFDVVKRLERGGKKDPLRQEIEKSIDVLKIWLNELEDERK